ncbi:MAG: hypothetical protein L0215_27290 [Gemmataceae bacterium]|nr:hypothetical protein [Gemmataceae bacterium]
MKIVIRLNAKQEALALPIILRQSPAMVLSNRTYILEEKVVQSLKRKGIKFKELSRQTRPQESRNGIAGIFGKWPGDETDEQIEQALKDLS